MNVGGRSTASEGFGVAELCRVGLGGDAVSLEIVRFTGGTVVVMDGELSGRALERIPDPFLVQDPAACSGRWSPAAGP